MRSDKERIIIRSFLAGFTSLALVWVVSSIGAYLFPCSDWSFCIPAIWRRLAPFEHSGIAISAFLLAAVAWYPLNKWKGSNGFLLNRLPSFDREDQINRAIQEDADPLELMLKRSKDEGLAVAITMTNEKVYIGRVIHPFNPATPTKNVGLLPLQSGYRDPVTKEMELTVDYSRTMKLITIELDKVEKKIDDFESKRAAELENNPDAAATRFDNEIERYQAEFDEIKQTISLFSLVVPVNQIASAHIFDSAVHAKYFRQRAEKHRREQS